MGERRPLRKWGWRLAGGILLVLAIGCRVPPPNVKAPEGPQVLNKPPDIAKYDTSDWPQQCMQESDPRKKLEGQDLFNKGVNANNLGGMSTQPAGAPANSGVYR